MKFTSEELALVLECGDCIYGTPNNIRLMNPDVLAGHLIEVHGYTVHEVEDGMDERIEEAIQRDIDNEAAYQESYYSEPMGYR